MAKRDIGSQKSENRKSVRHTWAWIYGVLLTGYTVFTLLQVFVIPHDTVKLDNDAMAYIYQENNRQASGSDSTIFENDTAAGTVSSEGNPDISDGTEAAVKEPTVTVTEQGYIYEDASTTITISQYYRDNTMVYVADIKLSSLAQLKSGLANDSFGRNVTEKTSEMASRLGAILAVNGDFYGFRDSGYVIRNGLLYRSTKKSSDAEDLVLWSDGSMEVIREGDITAEELLEAGALQVYSFGPGLVQDGEITVTASSEVSQSKTSNPRTAIGMISPLHYVMVVSDGRTNESEGLSLQQLAVIMKELGCSEAYNLDGGGSTTMYFNGGIINNPTSGGRKTKERSVSDIVYIG